MRQFAWFILVLSGASLSSSCVIDRRDLQGPDAEELVDAATDTGGDVASPDAPRDDVSLDTPPIEALDAADDALVLDAYALPDAYVPPDAHVPPDANLPDAYALPDAYSPDAYTPPDAFVCSGDIVYGQCLRGLRLWLDAADVSGVGEGGTVGRWTNRATSSATGDATRPGGEAAVTYTAMNGGAVVLGAGRLRTERDISVDRSTHFEVFVAITSRSNGNGYLFETDGSVTPRLSAHLPWTDPGAPARAYFDIPITAPAARIQMTFVPQAIYHAYRGLSGSALYANNVALPASGVAPVRDSRQKLWIGGADRTGVRNQLNLHELIIFNEPISDDARAAIRRAMQTRWFPTL
jgi:hypothetical protein